MSQPRPPLYAFIDESGQRGSSKLSSDHFVMSAVVIPDEHLASSDAFLSKLRTDLGRQPGDALHWNKIKTHAQRLHLSKSLGQQEWLTVSTVVVCKRHLGTGVPLSEDDEYLRTLRYLLSRLSWLAWDEGRILEYTLAHIVRFKIATLRAYETQLRAQHPSEIIWDHLSPMGGRIDQPTRVAQLQLADAVASATAAAFNADPYGNTELRYLRELAPRLYHPEGSALTSHGLKIHPWRENTRADYPWVAAL